MKIKIGQFFRFLLDKIGFPLEGQPEGQKSASPDDQAQPGEEDDLPLHRRPHRLWKPLAASGMELTPVS